MTICTKWPRLLVVGEPVTEAQADEILIRTNEWRTPFSNDKGWLATVEDIAAKFGRPREPHRSGDHDAYLKELGKHWPQMQAWRDRLGILDLQYLGNDQIMSAWYGGPHGWCSWNGTIGCDTYNIGKWPSDDEVTTEWASIAAAFPFLRLTAQCVDDEGEGRLAAEWRVADGRVTYVDEPSERITVPREISEAQWSFVAGERGVSPERLRQAFERVTR